MRRREFITLFGGAAVDWPLAARAQQPVRMRRIGMLTGIAGEDAETKVRIAAFLQELQRLGWTEGRNVQIEFVGVRAISPPCGNLRKNSLRLGPTLSSPAAMRLWRR